MRSPDSGFRRNTPNGAHSSTFAKPWSAAQSSTRDSPIELGQYRSLSGDVTTLNWINARSPRDLSASLGYSATRLLDGYWIMLLKEALNPDEFELGGITLRSGGRQGLPLDDMTADRNRQSVRQGIIDRDGQDHYNRMKMSVAGGAASVISGPMRVAKVLPMRRLPEVFSPKHEFPMGGGGAQWNINKGTPKRFLAAAYINSSAQASFGTYVNLPISYDDGPRSDILQNKTRLNNFLTNA